MKKNEGELPQYHVRNSHPAIVSAEVFELVQMEIESRRQFGSRYSGRGVFASRIVCADCGGFYGSKVWHSNDQISSNKSFPLNDNIQSVCFSCEAVSTVCFPRAVC